MILDGLLVSLRLGIDAAAWPYMSSLVHTHSQTLSLSLSYMKYVQECARCNVNVIILRSQESTRLLCSTHLGLEAKHLERLLQLVERNDTLTPHTEPAGSVLAG